MYLATAGITPVVFLSATLCAQVGPAQSGNFFVSNIRDNSVSQFDGLSGMFVGMFVEPGTGGLNGPTGIAFGPDGNLYVGSSANDRILRYDGLTGAVVDVFVHDDVLEAPFSLIFGPDDNLYVSSGTQHSVLRYDGSSGQYLGVAAAGGGLRQPIGLAFGRDGLLYVANSGAGNISRFRPESGEFVDVFATDSLRFPSDLAFDSAGHLLVSSAASSAIVQFDSTGAFMGTIVNLPDRGVPVGLVLAIDGDLMIGDFALGRLYRWTPSTGALELTADTGLAGPENIARKP